MNKTGPNMDDDRSNDRNRLDKWLWAARFFKTRALAAEAIAKGHVDVNGGAAKASRELREGDKVSFAQGHERREVHVRGLSRQRGSAPVAQRLYEETAESLAQRLAAAERRQQQPEPAASIEQGRPTKRDRRTLVDWTRWQASIDTD